MAGIFSFMKTMDPSSVVREGEFAAAAASAGVAAQAKNIYSKLTKGKRLTPDQAEAFKRIATYFIESKADSYDRIYEDMDRVYDQYNIPQVMRRTKATEQLTDFLNSQM
jgi:hypothetical protein